MDEKNPVSVEDLGTEEDPGGINPLPVDSPLLQVVLSEDSNIDRVSKHFPSGSSGPNGTLLLNDTRERKHEETPRDTIILSTDELALLLVDLTEGQKSGNGAVDFTRQDSFRGIVTPIEGTEGNIRMEERVEIEFPLMNQIGMGSYSDRVYCDGLQVVVNLSNLELTSAEKNSLLSEGLSFCPTPKYSGVFALRKDLSDFVRRLRLDKYLFNDGDVGGDFSDIPVFRKRSTCCPDRNRDLVLETCTSMLERRLFQTI